MPTAEEGERESNLRRFFEECGPSETGLVSRAKLFQCFQARTGANLNTDATETTPSSNRGQTSGPPVHEGNTAAVNRDNGLIDFEEFMARVDRVMDARARHRASLLLKVARQSTNQEADSESRTPPAMERNLFLSAIANGRLAVGKKRACMSAWVGHWWQRGKAPRTVSGMYGVTETLKC